MTHRLSSLLLCIIICILSASLSEAASSETLHYKVVYKWGLIQKQAGRATFTLNTNGNQCHAVMTARTESWADHIYSVRDTLTSVFNATTRLPSIYNRIAHEDGKFAHDIVTFTANGLSSAADCIRIRKRKKNEPQTRNEVSLEAQGAGVDLLSSFYYLRNLDFDSMTPGHSIAINIFSGKRVELLTITYYGLEKIKIGKTSHQVHKVTFRFTSKGKKKTSEPIDAWISTDKAKIPLKLVGELPIGKIQCIYIP